MRLFLILTTGRINKLNIVNIVKTPGKYSIIMNNPDSNGYVMLGDSGIDTKKEVIKICEKTNKQDYETVTDLINNVPQLESSDWKSK